jgi:hypothetical protein
MNLRREARNRDCMVRIPGICDGGGETTVLAHYRLAGTCGVGIKPPDILGAWCCGPCHDMVDGRVKRVIDGCVVSDEYIKLAHAEGVMRTIYQLEKEGKI